MRLFPNLVLFRKYRFEISVLVVCALAAGCHSPHLPLKPSIEITQVPAASPGGPVQMDFIEGRTTNAGPGQQVVIYAHSGIWWIQPFTIQPFTKVQPDATWKNSIHLGTEYAALLVDANYRPEAKLTALPNLGHGVVAMTTAKGRPVAPIVSKTLHFSGYDWKVRTESSDRGGLPNLYSPSNAWVDHNGYLHLRMSEVDGVWSCAEVSLKRSLGYGTYNFVVQDTGHLGPSGVLGIYTVDDYRTDDVRAELDVEMSRWGNPGSKNGQYVVQPFYVPENVARFMAPAGVLTHTLRWEPGRAEFKTFRGPMAGSGRTAVSEHVFTAGIPTAGNETVHFDIYDYHHSKSSPQQPSEVVIEKFEFLP